MHAENQENWVKFAWVTVKFIILPTKGFTYMPYKKEVCKAGKTKQYTFITAFVLT